MAKPKKVSSRVKADATRNLQFRLLMAKLKTQRKKKANPKKIRIPARDLAKTKAYITQDASHNYVLVSETGARFSLSTADAIRSQKSGVPYKAPRR